MVELDLHGYRVKEALEEFRVRYSELVYRVQDGKGNIRFRVITGRGLHSDGSPMIKMHLMGLLKRNDIPFSIVANGGGVQIMVKRGMAQL